jgi:cell division protein FtsI (penicillin-binding protein 3)
MQEITEMALLRMMQQIEALYGTCIVMETKTGKIKAIANLGKMDNSNLYWEDDNYALRVTEPGSTFKLVTFMAALDKGTSKPNDLIDIGTAGKMQVGPRVVYDAERTRKSVVTVEEALAHSSNVGLSKMAYKGFGNNPSEFGEYIKKYHMDSRSPIDLTHIPKPRLAPFAKGEGGLMNMITMSFGYAVQVSPLQTLTLYNAVANDGKMMKPYLVNSIRNKGVVIKQMEPQVIENDICKKNTLKAVKESLEMAITEGTGKYAFKGMPFKVAGKTGTAHVADGIIKYSHRVYQASFVGYFPADAPQYSCIVVVRTKPGGGLHFGGQVAAPVFREVATKLYAMCVDRKTPKGYEGEKDNNTYFYSGNTQSFKNVLTSMNIPFVDSVQQSQWASMYANNHKPVLKTNIVKNNLMPNVKGMGLRDAIRLLEQIGLRVQARGRGKISAQSIVPGAGFNKGQVVLLELS